MDGIATFTMKMSTTYMNCAATTTVRTSQRRGLIALANSVELVMAYTLSGKLRGSVLTLLMGIT
jgi:hypothetical protein